MYDRKVDDQLLSLEASGALYHNALVMQDSETNSIWPLMISKAIAGPLEGKPLHELPIAEKLTWGEWRAKHPGTLVLSHKGETHVDANRYENYFNSDKTFKPIENPDERLPLKKPIFTFKIGDHAYAIPYDKVKEGWYGKVGNHRVFIYRPEGASIYSSTRAFFAEDQQKPLKLKKKKGQWQTKKWGVLNPMDGTFANLKFKLKPLPGVDTFWYVWYPYYPNAKVL